MKLEQIIQLDERYYMNTFGKRFPVAFTHGQGCTLYDTLGREYTDFFSGIAVNCLGYAHPAFTRAMCEQMGKYIHISNLYYVEQQALLAQRLCENSCFDKVFFANSGAEANEGAIKLARKYFYEKGEEKYEIISAGNSFHGRTLATLSATGQAKYQKPYRPLVPSFCHVPYGDIAAMEAAINEKTCAIMLEAIQGEGGVIVAPEEYMRQVEALCRKKGLLLILDEVQTGMGRTGKLFCYEHYGIHPDIMTLAKALGNGMPIGAILAKEQVAAAFCAGDHGSTFGGGPLACTAGLAVMAELLEGGLVEKAAKTGEYFKKKLQQLAQKSGNVLQVRGKGLLLGMELKEPLSAKEIAQKALEKGYLIGTAGGNTLRFAPPLLICEREIDALCTCLGALL